VKIAIAVFGIKGNDRCCYQEIALARVANALASCGMADALYLVQWVRHMVGERGLFENPLAICLSKRRNREKQESYQGCFIHTHAFKT
jgi:hypothetical protein